MPTDNFAQPIRQAGWQLVYKHDGSPVFAGDKVNTSARDYVAIVISGRPPHHPISTGRVFVADPADSTRREREYFPQCFDLEWIKG